MIIYTGKHSYLLNDLDLSMIELGSVVYDVDAEKAYMMLTPGKLTEVNAKELSVETAEALGEAIAAGGLVSIVADIDAPTGYAVTADTTIVNDKVISVSKDSVGDGVFKVTSGTLTLEGKGTVNGVGDNKWNMAVWADKNGKVVINDGLFTNEGATGDEADHFDLIYASGNAQIEINGGEFKCQTPEWVLNIKNSDVATASIVVKGGKFHDFDPSKAQDGNFVAPGYKVVKEGTVYTVVKE